MLLGKFNAPLRKYVGVREDVIGQQDNAIGNDDGECLLHLRFRTTPCIIVTFLNTELCTSYT